MAAFDTSTAYALDYTKHRNILVADYYAPASDAVAVGGLRVKLRQITRPDYTRAAVGLELTPKSREAWIWNPSGEDFNVRPDGLLRLDDGSGWIIRNAVQVEEFGRWEAVVEAERTNG